MTGPAPHQPQELPRHAHRRLRRLATVTALLATSVALSACGAGEARSDAHAATNSGRIAAVGAESQYANVIAQVGGRYVSVSAIMDNPNIDPHTFEASPGVARTVGAARLVVQNGLGYDAFMSKIEAAAPDAGRRVIDVQRLLQLPDSTRNPHLWYDPHTMPAVAAAVARDLSALDPRHAAYFAMRARRFDASLAPWLEALARFRRRYRGAPVATTEPVGDYMLAAAGADDRTPWSLQADIMNGVDPGPQDVATEMRLLRGHLVKAFLYNQQVTDTVTQSFLRLARAHHVPVVGLYETMPAGYSYQSWMLAEVHALARAVGQGVSTTTL